MAIKIDVQELKEVLKITPSEQNIMIIGKHGIGKSKIITDYFTSKKMKVTAFFLGQMSDPGDLIGLMYKDEKTGKSDFMPPYWWPSDGEPVVLFLDELNRARPEILQSVMDLTLNKTLAGKKLPEGSIIISAVNHGDEYQLTDLDPALVSRFNIYEFTPTVEEWLIWADKHKLDKRVINFISKNKHFLDGDENTETYKDGFYSSLTKTPDRRAWERVSTMIKKIKEIDDIHLKAISGVVGVQAAMAFKKSLSDFSKLSPEDILYSFDKSKTILKKMKITELAYLNEQIILFINGENYEKRRKKTVLKNLNLYLKEMKKIKQNEVVAHFASLLENTKFSKATSVILVETPEIMLTIEEFIGDIKI